MPRRKQDCPKRMKWEGGEDGCPDEGGDKLDGDEESGSMTPTSAGSPAAPNDVDDADAGDGGSPPSAGGGCDAASSPSPRSTPAASSPPPPSNHLADRDLMTSPRCDSAELPPRRPSSGESSSTYSDRARGHTTTNSSPVAMGVALPPSLPAAALLPPQSAAMAAYLAAAAAAAAAAQHSHRLMSPLPPAGVAAFSRSSISPLVTSSSSPPGAHADMLLPLQSPPAADVLDFSKRSADRDSDHSDSDVMNLSKSSATATALSPPMAVDAPVNSPLDLSVTTRKRSSDDHVGVQQPPARKQRTSSSDYAKPSLPAWTSPVAAQHLPYFAAAVAAASSLSPKAQQAAADAVWNGKMKNASSGPTPSDATKALEKMSELSKLGGEDLFRSMTSGGGGGVGGASANSASSRHSAWQSHWLNKGADQAKDVLKCVWCKQSFPSLAAMTTHMKEAKHCGVNVPVPPAQQQQLQQQPESPVSRHQQQHHHQTHQPQTSSPSNTNTSSSSANSERKPSQSDLNLLIKETMPLPRKLVRGQDVWLGKGAEQTRQILKCMWCGQSFRSLAEMTSHMQQTQHYTNIISQEQIISWRSSDDSKNGQSGGGGSAGGGGGGNGPGGGGAGGGGAGDRGAGGGGGPPGSASSHVSAVLTCKVCDQAFSSLKELSNHMVKNSHYKEHIMRSITESGGRRRQTREKRKKSLPVRKLLELERAQHDFKNGDVGGMDKRGDGGGGGGAGRITCEKCGNKIETSMFVDHIRQCVGMTNHQRNFLKNALMSNNILPPEAPPSREAKTTKKSPSPSQLRSPTTTTTTTTTAAGDGTKEAVADNNNGSSPSVLNAIEKLIEKSFDSRGRQNAGAFPGQAPTAAAGAPMGSSILKRLGIDESVDYTKPLVDAQTMNLLRNYHQHHQQQHFGGGGGGGKRERSGSESSSISERGSSRVDALTPERKMEPPMSTTPRSTPDKREQKSPSVVVDKADACNNIKKEVDDEDTPLEIKKEAMDDEDDDKSSFHSNNGPIPLLANHHHHHHQQRGTPPPEASPCRNSTSSPASSDRSTGTPRSTNGDRGKTAGGGSLGALSSMFDSLSANASGAENTPASGGGGGGGKRGSSHPLAALQKLCDKTETTHHTTGNNRSSSSTPSSATSAAGGSNTATATTSAAATTAPGAILAFSWACNDAVMTSDSIMKCAFCDTPFISKGAYRHHLSKMHFVKDGVIPDPVKAGGSGSGAGSSPAGASSGGKCSSAAVASASSAPGSKSPSPSPSGGGGGGRGGGDGGGGGFEESPHSKFLKYTELAKQLSSKYV